MPAWPFFFAYTDEPPTGGIAFGPEHQVEDEQIVPFRIDHAEGQIPTLNIDIRNRGASLLSGQIWAWLSYDTGAGVVRCVLWPSCRHPDQHPAGSGDAAIRRQADRLHGAEADAGRDTKGASLLGSGLHRSRQAR
jgi:hypothetical protein